MPVPSSIDDLSTTAGSNSPAGGETPKDGDNYIRALSAFIATLRDKLDGTSDTGTITNATFSGTTAGLRVPLVSYKTATTSRTSTTTVSNDPHLSVTLEVGTYAFQMWLPFWGTTSTNQGLRLQFSGTATLGSPVYATYDGSIMGSQVGSSLASLLISNNISNISASADGSNGDALHFTGVITCSSGGTFALQWAQQVSSSNATNVGAGAWMTALKVS